MEAWWGVSSNVCNKIGREGYCWVYNFRGGMEVKCYFHVFYKFNCWCVFVRVLNIWTSDRHHKLILESFTARGKYLMGYQNRTPLVTSENPGSIHDKIVNFTKKTNIIWYGIGKTHRKSIKVNESTGWFVMIPMGFSMTLSILTSQ